MNRLATWKVVSLGAALVGFSLLGAGAASAYSDISPHSAYIASDQQGSVALPPNGPVAVYPQDGIGGANPYTPFGPNPYVPYGVWQR